jgi:centrosomal protein CEP164
MADQQLYADYGMDDMDVYGDEDDFVPPPGMEGFEFLEEEMDANYEPSNEEIVDYAKYLGINPAVEKDLLYIAKEGLKAPLPSTWKPCKSPRQGTIYYYNVQNGETQKEHPCDDYYKENVVR